MCLFPFKNRNTRSAAYKYGITEYECGGCPECLKKKSRRWALRCSMEAKVSQGMMITLTYDTYKYDNNGNIIGEVLRDDLSVNKRDCQNFIKRLRAKFPDKNIKYMLSAEYGKRTHRPHYHALIFGLVFDDLVQYKKSKRGNIIYRSQTLEKIWQGGKEHKGGICTVDCTNLTAKVANYCTKYCAKDSGVDDTFMLFSRGIGFSQLLKEFDGVSYWIDGNEYPIPRLVWSYYIEQKYNCKGFSRYKNLNDDYSNADDYVNSMFLNRIYREYRDNDSYYQKYLVYWKEKARVYNEYRPSVFERITSLPDDKYRSYKFKALKGLQKSVGSIPYVPPRSNSRSEYFRLLRKKGCCPSIVPSIREKVMSSLRNLAYQPCHYTPNDRIFEKEKKKDIKKVRFYDLSSNYWIKSPFEVRKKEYNFLDNDIKYITHQLMIYKKKS